jgi:hypothetical protein
MIGSWKTCQHKTFLNYVLSLEEESGKGATLGTMVHKVMEILALCKLREQNNSMDIINDDVVGIVSPTFNFKDSVEVFDLTDKVYDFYSNRSTKSYMPRDRKGVHKSVDIVLDTMGGVYDPRKCHIFDAEKHFDFQLDMPWAKYEYELKGEKHQGVLSLKGTIDLIVDVGNNTIEVRDYKNGKRTDYATGKVKDYKALQQDKQLIMYYYALKKLYPDKNVLFTIYYINDGGPFTLCYEDKDIREIEEYLEKMIKEVWSCQTPKMLSYYQTDFRCNKVCEFYKKNWPGTDKNVCKFIHDEVKDKGIQHVTDNYMRKGFTPNHYQNPGS